MYYLKCEKCGQFNQLKSEYLVFCSKCKEKMTNNYTFWKKSHPSQSFDNFKHSQCISGEQMQKQSLTEQQSKKKNLKYWIRFATTCLVFSWGVSYYVSNWTNKQFSQKKRAKELQESKWLKKSYETLDLNIEIPFELNPKKIPVTDDLANLIAEIETFNNEEKGFALMANHVQYKPTIGKSSLQGAADGAIKNITNKKKVEDLHYTQSATRNNGIPGILQKRTFYYKKTNTAFYNAIFSKNLLLWQISLIYPDDDEKIGETIAKRIINSIEINK